VVPDSPVDALGPHASGLRYLLVEIVRTRHDLAAEAHQVAESRYGMGFGSQWRDLLDDTRDALISRGFRSCKLVPGGQEVPVVNDSLVYVWRVPNNPNAVDEFASSPTRRNSFVTAPLDPVLWEPSLSDGQERGDDIPEGGLGPVLSVVSDTMPLVLVMVESTPRQLQSIEWAVAGLDDAGKVELRGRETIWAPELGADGTASDVEPFNSGMPVTPVVGLRKQDRPHPDA
jgi:hypothetical protein